MRETWYVLEDGRTVDPNDVTSDEAGVLRHATGVAVAMRGGVPHSRGVDDPDAERAKPAAGGSKPAGKGKKDIKPDDQQLGYKTRETKAD